VGEEPTAPGVNHVFSRTFRQGGALNPIRGERCEETPSARTMVYVTKPRRADQSLEGSRKGLDQKAKRMAKVNSRTSEMG